MEMIGWIVAIVMFIIAFAGLVYPIIPSALFILGGFLLYGLIATFDGMTSGFLDYSNSIRHFAIRCGYIVESCWSQKVWWFEGRNVGKYNWSSHRSFRHSSCWHFSWSFFRCSHCRTC